MTVYSDVSRVRYVANGITKEFVVPFPYLTNSDGSAQLSVYLGDSDTALVEGKDYYVEGIGSFNQEVGFNVENELDDTLKTYEERFDSGTVIFYNAPVIDQAIAILRNVPNTQGVVFINGENFPAADYANALDKLTMKVQELEEKSDRSVILPPTSKEKPIEVRENIIKAADEAKKTAETAIAEPGRIDLSNPLSTSPRQSHSSKRGANTDTEINVIHTGASMIWDIASSNHSGVSGMMTLRLSTMKAVAIVAIETITAILKPPSCPK